jgi:LPPG:FO 2-phospho-L-lactate transferase
VITALAGGVGAARFLSGLAKIVTPQDLTVIGNTGDDMELYGLHISPDLDIVAYTLAGIVDDAKGWGIKGDSFQFLEALKRFGCETWFNIGDRDLATHIYRTTRLKQGLKLSEVTAEICKAFELETKLLPMTDAKFETHIKTKQCSIHFEEYFVKRAFADEVVGVEFPDTPAEPAPGVIRSIEEAEMIVVCPSNPIVSIGTILSLNGLRQAIRQSKARKVAISPIIGGAPFKGPADKLMRGLGLEVSAFSVAELYADFLDTYIIDTVDAAEKPRIERLGVEVKVTNTLMHSLDDKVRLAKAVLAP